MLIILCEINELTNENPPNIRGLRTILNIHLEEISM